MFETIANMTVLRFTTRLPPTISFEPSFIELGSFVLMVERLCEHLWDDWCNQSMQKVTLPCGLQALTFGVAFNPSIKKVTLSSASARIHLRCVLGVLNSYGSEGPPLKTIAINVTVLTRMRLIAVMQQAKSDGVAVVAMQETRHPKNGFRWAAKVTSAAGWRIQWSDPPNLNKAGNQLSAGGTALMWRRELGRSTACTFDAPQELLHRACGRAWGETQIWSAYGDPTDLTSNGLVPSCARR